MLRRGDPGGLVPRRGTAAWSMAGIERPWQGQLSIRERLTTRSERRSGVLPAAPGSSAATVAHLEPTALAASVVTNEVASALVALLGSATSEHLMALDRLLTRRSVLGVVHEARLSDVVNVLAPPERVRALGRVLAREAPHLAGVRLGLALLGTLSDGQDRELLLELGAHEALTDHAAAALMHQTNDLKNVLALARNVSGWGRIHAVERMGETTDPEIQAWMLREGFRNTVNDEQLAFTCALTGELHLALAAASVDEALMHGAAEIFIALGCAVSAPDLADYPFRDAAIGAWLGHLRRRRPRATDLQVLRVLADCPGVSVEQREAIAGLWRTLGVEREARRPGRVPPKSG